MHGIVLVWTTHMLKLLKKVLIEKDNVGTVWHYIYPCHCVPYTVNNLWQTICVNKLAVILI